MSGHTKGPWTYVRNPENTRWIIDSAPSHAIACTAGHEPDNEANARRIVACVNALEGLDPAGVADVVAAAEALIQNRDDNCCDREELKTCHVISSEYWSPAASMVNSKQVAALRTALARIRGEG